MNVHFSSKKHDWATAWPLFRNWMPDWGRLTLDVCATARNAKCGKFFSPEDDGLSQVWHGGLLDEPALRARVATLDVQGRDRSPGESRPQSGLPASLPDGYEVVAPIRSLSRNRNPLPARANPF